MRWRLLLISVFAPLALWAALPLVSQGEPKARSAQAIQKKIEVTREKIGKRKGTERVLTKDITRYNQRIETLQQRIDRYNARQRVIQSDLDVKRARLARTQEELRSERRRLARLRARLTEARGVLSERLVQLYKADKPDLVTVVLNSRGFADLIERGDFLERINKQDRTIVRLVKNAKKDATATAARLDELERRQQTITERILARRNEIAQVKQDIIDTKVGYDRTKDGKAAALRKVRAERHDLEGHLKGLEKEQAKVQAALQAPAAGSIPTGSFRGTGGRLTTPTQGTFTSPFGQRWGRLHAGIDIAAPTGTAIVAADSGKVVLMGPTGGYGNYTCIQHNQSMSTCYAHQSAYGTSLGANVRRGQRIGSVGNTGNSTGPHLHFEVRINGTPVNPMLYL
ncbi:murein hydrolase activator EnvC [Paraconexibacter sp.]|uniref:murein hydrolase activator EnvC family protein n=1 Tax=Paraconexibacter sp. TaxID=2949640 RepID=UPI0035679168